MDVKASARAKHASSQRGRARHSTRKHPPPPPQQQQQQEAANEPRQPQPSLDKNASPLPSNWSRYDEEEPIQDDRLSDLPAVKSKGANYRDLLAEKSMFQAPDLASRRKGLMEARGLDLWARLADVDNIWSVHEVPGDEDNFLSLDLDFLNQELAKVDIAERLLVDPKYIPLEERQKSEAMYKDLRAETDNENEAFASPAMRTNSDVDVVAEVPASESPHEVNLLHRSSVTVYEEAGRDDVLDHGFFKEIGTSLNERETSFPRNNREAPGKELPQFHNKVQTVLKETVAELPKSTKDIFEAKSAEAELDALLDMLDNGAAGSLLPTESVGSVKNHGSASQGSYLDVLQGISPLDQSADTSIGTLLNSNDSRLHIRGSSEVAINVGNVPSGAPALGNVKSVPDLEEDFDDWLDSL